MVDPALGQINQAGDPNAIFLKVFSGEVLTAFKLATIADALQRTRWPPTAHEDFDQIRKFNERFHQINDIQPTSAPSHDFPFKHI